MDDDKKLAWIIVVGIPVALILWWWGYKGGLEVRVPGMTQFAVQLDDQTARQCQEYCRFRLRAGKSFRGIVTADGYVQKSFASPMIEAFGTRMIELSLETEVGELTAEEQAQKQAWRQVRFPVKTARVYGPVLYDEADQFAVFAEQRGEQLLIYVLDQHRQESLLTTVPASASLDQFTTGFALRPDGIVLPTADGEMWYDFAQRRKYLLRNTP